MTSPKRRAGEEWVGARVALPQRVDEGEHSYELELLLLLEVGGPIVRHALEEPQTSAMAMADLLRQAMLNPLDGPPRRPSRVRFADAELASEVRATGLGIEIVVGPTPEIDDAMESFRTFLSERLPPAERRTLDDVTAFFRATKSVYDVAPWRELTDADGIRIDIPALDVVGGCLSVKGNRGSGRGFLFFLSLADFKAFIRTAEETHEWRPFTADPGLSILSLTFERGADAPERMRRDIAEHGWPVADAQAYPVAERLELLRGRRTFPGRREMQILTACSRALAAFTLAHRPALDTIDFFLATETFADEAGLTVRIALPYEAIHDSWVLTFSNDPRARVVRKVSLYAAERFGSEWAKQRALLPIFEQERDLGVPLLAFDVQLEGRRVGEWFRDERANLPDEERAWLDAELAAWLSVWSVVETDRVSGGVLLKDLLTGKAVEVLGRETTGVKPGDAILARVIERDGAAFLGGMHTRIVHSEIAYVIDRVRKRLRRVTAVPVERLRSPAIFAAMIRIWVEAIAIEDALYHRSQ